MLKYVYTILIGSMVHMVYGVQIGTYSETTFKHRVFAFRKNLLGNFDGSYWRFYDEGAYPDMKRAIALISNAPAILSKIKETKSTPSREFLDDLPNNKPGIGTSWSDVLKGKNGPVTISKAELIEIEEKDPIKRTKVIYFEFKYFDVLSKLAWPYTLYVTTNGPDQLGDLLQVAEDILKDYKDSIQNNSIVNRILEMAKPYLVDYTLNDTNRNPANLKILNELALELTIEDTLSGYAHALYNAVSALKSTETPQSNLRFYADAGPYVDKAKNMVFSSDPNTAINWTDVLKGPVTISKAELTGIKFENQPNETLKKKAIYLTFKEPNQDIPYALYVTTEQGNLSDLLVVAEDIRSSHGTDTPNYEILNELALKLTSAQYTENADADNRAIRLLNDASELLILLHNILPKTEKLKNRIEQIKELQLKLFDKMPKTEDLKTRIKGFHGLIPVDKTGI